MMKILMGIGMIKLIRVMTIKFYYSFLLNIF